MVGKMSMSSIEAAVAGLIAKFGTVKVLAFGTALLGAGVMCLFRPPKTKMEVFNHAVVAGAGSFLFGPLAVSITTSWLNEPAALVTMPVHFLVGALSWGAMAGIATYRDKLTASPKEAIQDVKDISQ